MEDKDAQILELKRKLIELEDRLYESKSTRRFREKMRAKQHARAIRKMSKKLVQQAKSARDKRHELYVALKRAEEELHAEKCKNAST